MLASCGSVCVPCCNLHSLRRLAAPGVLLNQSNTFVETAIKARPHPVPLRFIRYRWERCPQLVDLVTKSGEALFRVVHQNPTLSLIGWQPMQT
jgi:hypothetical protein